MVDTGDITHIARYFDVFQCWLIDIPRIGQLFTTDFSISGKQWAWSRKLIIAGETMSLTNDSILCQFKANILP